MKVRPRILSAVATHVQQEAGRIGWAEFSRRSGVERSLLYKCFGGKPRQSPTVETIERVLACVGLSLSIERVTGDAR